MRRRLPARIHHYNNKHFQKLGNPPSNQAPIVSLCAWRAGSPWKCLGFHQDPGMVQGRQQKSWEGALSTARNGVTLPEGQDFTWSLQGLGGHGVSSMLV